MHMHCNPLEPRCPLNLPNRKASDMKAGVWRKAGYDKAGAQQAPVVGGGVELG
jgi:hypothetical protein